MSIDTNPIYLGVIGKPILQSLSPLIHKTALEKTRHTGAYLRLGVDSAKEALTLATEMGLKGFNITAPYKEEILKEVKVLDRTVTQIWAANTVLFDDTPTAFNTDVYGILHSLGITTEGAHAKTALIIGAGGAAKAAAFGLKQSGCRVFICNRTVEKAEKVAKAFGANQISFEDASQLLKNTDFLINTIFTTEALLDLSHLQKTTLILDAIYAKETPLSKECRNNPNYIDGKIWLLNQGIKAFELFTKEKITESQLFEIKEKLFSKPLPRPETVSLIGMMGSGKSSVGKSLSSILERDYVDLDEVIEQKAGCSIASLVTEKGEETFRKLESECLEQVLENKPKVLSCGGGIIGNQGNRSLLNDLTVPIWLWASKEELTRRLSKYTNRPLLFGQDLATRVGELLDQRFADYAGLSKLVINTTGKTTADIAKQIAFELINVE